MTTPIDRVRAIEKRMVEIGKPKHHAFNQGDLTWAFADGGYVMVSVDGKNKSALYPDHRKFSIVYSEFIK